MSEYTHRPPPRPRFIRTTGVHVHDFSKLKMSLAAIEKRRLRIVEERDDKLDRLKYKRKKNERSLVEMLKRLNRQRGVETNDAKRLYKEEYF